MNIKNKSIGIITFVIVVISLFSCKAVLGLKSLGVYDKTVYKEQLVTLFIPNYYMVECFDGKAVKWKGAGWGTIMSIIKLPAGEHVLEYKYVRDSGGWSVPQQGIDRNQRVTTSTYTQRIHNDFERNEKVIFESGKMYIVGESIEIYDGGIYVKAL